jgi:hypothetical protein
MTVTSSGVRIAARDSSEPRIVGRNHSRITRISDQTIGRARAGVIGSWVEAIPPAIRLWVDAKFDLRADDGAAAETYRGEHAANPPRRSPEMILIPLIAYLMRKWRRRSARPATS